MYCRKCGKEIDRHLTRCPHCGTDVVEVRQRSYAQKYEEEKKSSTPYKTVKQASDYPKDAGIRDNRYLSPAIVTAFSAFILAWFPWPKSWGIGTSLWMRILIILLALLSLYHSVKANQIINYNLSQAKKYNQRHPKNQISYTKPGMLRIANVLAILTVLISTFALFMG